MKALAVLCLLAVLAACSPSPRLSAQQVVDGMTEAGLDAPNPRDVTEQECPASGCVEAVATDVVTVSRWKDADDAANYSSGLEQPAYSVDEFVIAFPRDTTVKTNPYADRLVELSDANRTP